MEPPATAAWHFSAQGIWPAISCGTPGDRWLAWTRRLLTSRVTVLPPVHRRDALGNLPPRLSRHKIPRSVWPASISMFRSQRCRHASTGGAIFGWYDLRHRRTHAACPRRDPAAPPAKTRSHRSLITMPAARRRAPLPRRSQVDCVLAVRGKLRLQLGNASTSRDKTADHCGTDCRSDGAVLRRVRRRARDRRR